MHWYDGLCTLVYTSHFLATPIVAAILWLRARDLWIRYISRVIVLSFGGLITYVLFPEAPPWLASQRRSTWEPVSRLSTHGVDLAARRGREHRRWRRPRAPVPTRSRPCRPCTPRSQPSSRCSSARLLTTRWRYLLLLYPLAMAFTLVYTGEHYVLDCIAGALYALAAHFGIRWWERRRAARGADPATEVAEATSIDDVPQPS